MTPRLSEEMRQALTEHPGQPISVVDPTTQTTYVLVRAEVFEQMQALLGDFDIRETYAAQEAVASEAGWKDPELDIYNDDRHQPQP